MIEHRTGSVTAFNHSRHVRSGGIVEVAEAAKGVIDADEGASVLIFDDTTGRLVEVDFRGTADDVRARLAAVVGLQGGGEGGDPTYLDEVGSTPPRVPRGPGRPRLGVIAREVTLLPRHWEWLGRQPGGASVALRKLVDEARRVHEGTDRVRRAREVTYQFMLALAGDRPGYEEATRALFAGDRARFEAQLARWPPDVAEHARRLAEGAFERG